MFVLFTDNTVFFVVVEKFHLNLINKLFGSWDRSMLPSTSTHKAFKVGSLSFAHTRKYTINFYLNPFPCSKTGSDKLVHPSSGFCVNFLFISFSPWFQMNEAEDTETEKKKPNSMNPWDVKQLREQWNTAPFTTRKWWDTGLSCGKIRVFLHSRTYQCT